MMLILNYFLNLIIKPSFYLFLKNVQKSQKLSDFLFYLSDPKFPSIFKFL